MHALPSPCGTSVLLLGWSWYMLYVSMKHSRAWLADEKLVPGIQEVAGSRIARARASGDGHRAPSPTPAAARFVTGELRLKLLQLLFGFRRGTDDEGEAEAPSSGAAGHGVAGSGRGGIDVVR